MEAIQRSIEMILRFRRSSAFVPSACAGALLASVFAAGGLQAQQLPAGVPQTDSSYIDASGTAHVTRVVPVPKTVSPEAQQFLARRVPDTQPPQSIEQIRAAAAKYEDSAGHAAEALYPVTMHMDKIAGVPVRIVDPVNAAADKKDRVLINVHGGGFTGDWGSQTETIPIAALTGTQVVAVLYRMAPEHPFPADVDDTVAVYRELLKTHKPENIGLYGTSAGAILTAETAVKIKQLGLPLPGALGVFSGMGDFSRTGDSQAIFGLDGLSGPLKLDEGSNGIAYVGNTDRRDPVLSPIFADLHGMPPTLFVTSTRDLLLSGTVNLHRAFLSAGAPAELIVYEALPHAFWNNAGLPESKEADRAMAAFFDAHLGQRR
jgi:monoterpene epsilon-lactone hydrolase